MNRSKTIADVAEKAMNSIARPATAEEIHVEIERLKLYKFNTPKPVHVLETELKRYSGESLRADKRKEIRFKIGPHQTYSVLKKVSPDQQIEAKYLSAVNRIHQERGDFLLPQIVDYISQKKWIDPRPDYQRRLVWNNKEKSLFLESLLMNLPVPPLVIYEHEYGQWEIMDGQQRSTALVDFYSNSFRLVGLDRWDELNGKTYADCPPIVRKGFDRRRLQVTTILAESVSEDDFDTRKEVFERLNTGGKPLNPQEIRNCLYSGKLCDLLEELSSDSVFTQMWRIPDHLPPKKMGKMSAELLDNKLFSRMHDCEIVLRFFAFESSKFLSGAVKKALDGWMRAHHKIDELDLECLRNRYHDRLRFAHEIFGPDAFIAKGTPAKKIYDALMASLARFEDRRSLLNNKKIALRKNLATLLKNDETYKILIDQHDSKDGFHARVKLICDMIKSTVIA